MKQIVFFLVAFLFASLVRAQNDVEYQQLSKRTANYDISVELDHKSRTLTGKEILYWQNPSDNYIKELRFHLYMNAFKNSETTFSKEGGNRGSNTDKLNKDEWGWINISSMTTSEGSVLTDSIKFIQPDDGNPYDQTVISVKLDKPIRPYQNIKIFIDFETKLPKVVARTGYVGNYYLVGQWFPKIGVYETKGMRYAEEDGWNCHQFHANSEFYANFGNYQVEITVPQEFIVGATGKLKREEQRENNLKKLTFIAEDVVDFAWTASPEFVVYDSAWEDVDIKILSMPLLSEKAPAHLKALTAALEYFKKYLGKYPYPSITVVVPPSDAMESGGMEYPMFITSMDFWGVPAGLRFPESVTIHEFGHQYFMGILASNEFEEAWLDEGFNTYFEARIMNDTYGDDASMVDFAGIKINDKELQRISYVNYSNPSRAEIARNSWDYKQGGYGVLTYYKTAAVLFTMEGILGSETMNEILKTYYDRWKFNHPSGKDFINISNEIITKNFGSKFGENFNWFFDELIYGDGQCDYKVMSISNNRIHKKKGVFDWENETPDSSSADLVKPEVRVYRSGEIQLPVEILVHFENGDEELLNWNGKSRTFEKSWIREDGIQWVKVDPYNKIWIDTNLKNNSLTIKPENLTFLQYSQKFLFWLENVLLSFGMLF